VGFTRLSALSSATLCIYCERQVEKYPGRQDRSGKENGDQIIDSNAPTGDHGIKLSEMEMGLSNNC
jgi:hypothetical protein